MNSKFFLNQYIYSIYCIAMDIPITTADIQSRLGYAPHTNTTPKNIHIGQRKMFLAHLQFLTLAVSSQEEIYYVVYAGAAPGISSFQLSDMFFPNVKFILFDPQRINMKGVKMNTKTTPNIIKDIVYSNKRLFIFNEFFTEEIAYLFKDKFPNMLFISDIRLHSISKSFPTDKDVLICNSMQFNWINIMKPIMSSLKFRQPFYTDDSVEKMENVPHCLNLSRLYGIDFIKDYKEKNMTYFKGKFYMQAWSRHTSSETRLLVDANDGYALDKIDVALYEDSMYYYNKIQRTQKIFKQPIENCDNCGDCALESHIIIEYYNKYNIYDPAFIKKYLNKIFKNIH